MEINVSGLPLRSRENVSESLDAEVKLAIFCPFPEK